MGLLDYYRQFDDIDQESVNRVLRERRRRERELALAEVPTIDLSSTEWPDFPHSEIMNAAIYAARGRVNSYPDRHATREVTEDCKDAEDQDDRADDLGDQVRDRVADRRPGGEDGQL